MRWTKHNSALRQKIVGFLTSLPNLYDSDKQWAFVCSAGLEAELKHTIRVGMSQAQFVQTLIATLSKHDKIEAILEAAKQYVGENRRQECDTLIQELRSKPFIEEQPFPDYSRLPLDFSAKIEFLAQYFVGRQEAIKQVDQFIQTHPSGYLAIVGEAGIGKSALLAKLVKERGYLHHFVDDKQNSAKDEVFLRCIVEQLQQKYGFEFEERTPISVSEWNIYFQKWLKEASAEGKIVICVDALDEAQHYGGSDSLLKYLPHELPENVYFILTSRPEFKKEDITLFPATVFETYILPELTQTDLERYLSQRNIAANTEVAGVIWQKSEGNPLYLYHLIEECDSKNLTLEQINQLPQGLMKFYEKQWQERIRFGDKAIKEGRKQISCLLLILKEPPNEDMLLSLTDFDRAELQDYLIPLSRFMRTGERYTIFHDSFKNFLQNQFAKTLAQSQTNLVDRLWHWQELQEPLRTYALAWLPNHLFDAQNDDRLFQLARNRGFQQIQMQAFPNEPSLPLRTIQFALQRGTDIDNATVMAEFLLAHAYHIEMMKQQETPLDAVRHGNIPRAWELADVYDIESCIQWYLLIAWELKDMQQMQAARETLIRLRQKDLPYFGKSDTHRDTFWGQRYFLFERSTIQILSQMYDIDEQSFTDLCQRLINDYDEMRRVLAEQQNLTALRKILNLMTEPQRIEALGTIAISQAQQGNIVDAQMTVQEISPQDVPISVLAVIAEAQAQTGDLTGAQSSITTALILLPMITDHASRVWVLRKIALVQKKVGDHIAARLTLETAQADALQISEIEERLGNLIDIAEIQIEIDEYADAGVTIEAAQVAVQQIPEAEDRSRYLRNIAKLQVRKKDYAGAGLTLEATQAAAQQILDDYARAKCLQDIAETRVQAGDVSEALSIALQLTDWHQAETFQTIAIAQAKGGDVSGALSTARQITAHERIYWDREQAALREIAVTQVEAGDISSALAIASQQSNHEATGILKEIIIAQAQVGDLEGARATIQQAVIVMKHIQNDAMSYAFEYYSFVDVLMAIAEAEAKAGDMFRARCTLSEAASIKFQEFPQDLFKKRRFLDIAAMQTQIRDTSGARQTFALMLRKIQEMRLTKRDDSLIAIAFIQAQTGDISEAIATIKPISKGYGKDKVFQAIAIAQVQKGNITEALATVQQISDNEEQIGTLFAIQKESVNLAERNTQSLILDAMQTIENQQEQIDILTGILLKQIMESKDLVTARLTLSVLLARTEQISDESERDKALIAITLAQASLGEETNALATFQQIRDIRKREQAILLILAWMAYQILQSRDAREREQAIALTQVFLGEETDALTIAQQITDEEERNAVLVGIACAQGLLGEETNALKTAQQITNEEERENAFRAIFLVRLFSEDIQSVLIQAQQLSDEWERAMTFDAIADILTYDEKLIGDRDNFAFILAVANNLKSDSIRTRIFKSIAIAQIKAGFVDDALLTVEQIVIKRHEHLPAIAAAFADKGDKASFKRLLLPCAYYLDAAYAMCGHLARLYPEQATAIADVLLQYEPL